MRVDAITFQEAFQSKSETEPTAVWAINQPRLGFVGYIAALIATFPLFLRSHNQQSLELLSVIGITAGQFPCPPGFMMQTIIWRFFLSIHIANSQAKSYWRIVCFHRPVDAF